MQEILDDNENDFYGANDLSFLTTMRMKQEKRNLEVYLRFLERQKRRSLEMYEYQKEQTELDLEERVKLKSSYLSELCNTIGKKESIAISRRESLNVLRAHNGRTWNMATGTYHVKTRPHESKEYKRGQLGFHQRYCWQARRDVICNPDTRVFSKEPKLPLDKPRSRFPLLRREHTDSVVRKRAVVPINIDIDILLNS